MGNRRRLVLVSGSDWRAPWIHRPRICASVVDEHRLNSSSQSSRIHNPTASTLLGERCPLGLSDCYIYKVSLRSLFILAILEETDRSMVRSPISTMSPPRISGLTLETTLSFWPLETYCDLLTAASRRERVLLSRAYKTSAFHLCDPPVRTASTYSSAGYNELNLATVGTHQDAKVVYDTL